MDENIHTSFFILYIWIYIFVYSLVGDQGDILYTEYYKYTLNSVHKK